MSNRNEEGASKNLENKDAEMCECECEKGLFRCIPQNTVVDVWFVAGFVRGTYNSINDCIVIITNPTAANNYNSPLGNAPGSPIRIPLKYITAVAPA